MGIIKKRKNVEIEMMKRMRREQHKQQKKQKFWD